MNGSDVFETIYWILITLSSYFMLTIAKAFGARSGDIANISALLLTIFFVLAILLHSLKFSNFLAPNYLE